MDDNIYLGMLSLSVVLLCAVTVNYGYQLKPVVLPADVNNVRIFTEDELSLYDASDVCFSTNNILFVCYCDILLQTSVCDHE